MNNPPKPKSPSQAIPKRRTTRGGQCSRVRQGQPRSTNKRRTVVPPPQSARIVGRYIAGASIREISRVENRDRATVTKIVRSDQVHDYICKLKERFYGLGDDALNAVQHAVREQGDARLAYQILQDIGIVPSREERNLAALQQSAAAYDEEGEVIKTMGRLIQTAIERARVFGTRCPELEADLEKVGGRINYETATIEPIKEKP